MVYKKIKSVCCDKIQRTKTNNTRKNNNVNSALGPVKRSPTQLYYNTIIATSNGHSEGSIARLKGQS
jgi:hypothetical protein